MKRMAVATGGLLIGLAMAVGIGACDQQCRHIQYVGGKPCGRERADEL